MSALAYRPVWIRYGQYLPWHVIKGDVQVMTDLKAPLCGWRVGTLPIAETSLTPTDRTPICTACLVGALRVEGWTLEGFHNEPPTKGEAPE